MMSCKRLHFDLSVSAYKSKKCKRLPSKTADPRIGSDARMRHTFRTRSKTEARSYTDRAPSKKVYYVSVYMSSKTLYIIYIYISPFIIPYFGGGIKAYKEKIYFFYFRQSTCKVRQNRV